MATKKQAPKKNLLEKLADAITAADSTAMAQIAATVTAEPVVAAPAPVVAVRGGLAISKVKLTGVVYKVSAVHNANWWKQCQEAVATAGGEAAVADLVKAGVPAIFVGYVVRRGYMAAA